MKNLSLTSKQATELIILLADRIVSLEKFESANQDQHNTNVIEIKESKELYNNISNTFWDENGELI